MLIIVIHIMLEQIWKNCIMCGRLTGHTVVIRALNKLDVPIQSKSWLIVPWQLVDVMNLVKFQHTPEREKKETSMRWKTRSMKQFSKASINKNQREHMTCSDEHIKAPLFHHSNFYLSETLNTSLSSSFILHTTIICRYLGLSHGPPTCPWHLYSFCSLCRLCISKCRFHSWHVGGVLGRPNRTLTCWKSG